jgi:glycosyltransferase involved in cell wall biosynthesis
MKPTVTILLATFNRAHLISKTLDSILAQSYSNWECIIVDDYSIDTTKEVVDEYLQKDNRFNYFLKTEKYKKGLSGSRNFGLDIAASRKAQFIQLFDDDDIMHPQKLKLQISPMIVDNSLDFSVCKYRHYYGDEVLKFELQDEDCKIVSDNLFEDFFLGKMGINSLGQIWKGDLLLKYRFDENLLYAEERDLYLRIFLYEKPKYKNIDYVLFYYRKHLISNTKNRYDSKSIKIALYILELNLFEFVKVNSLWNFFLLNEMSKTFIYKYYDYEICKELISVIKNNNFDNEFKGKLLTYKIRVLLLIRKVLVKIHQKI